MSLNIINDFITWLDQTFQQLEDLIANNSSNPLLWIFVVAGVLFMVAMAYNTLSK